MTAVVYSTPIPASAVNIRQLLTPMFYPKSARRHPDAKRQNSKRVRAVAFAQARALDAAFTSALPASREEAMLRKHLAAYRTLPTPQPFDYLARAGEVLRGHGSALARGTDVHKLLDEYIQRTIW